MSNTQSLLGCPFCGGMATAKPIDSVPGWYHVTVLHSDCFYKPAQDKMLLNDEHLAAWNRRAPQPTQAQADALPLTDEQLEKLRIGQEWWQWGMSETVFRHVARAIERAHGIAQKGGSNADTGAN